MFVYQCREMGAECCAQFVHCEMECSECGTFSMLTPIKICLNSGYWIVQHQFAPTHPQPHPPWAGIKGALTVRPMTKHAWPQFARLVRALAPARSASLAPAPLEEVAFVTVQLLKATCTWPAASAPTPALSSAVLQPCVKYTWRWRCARRRQDVH